MEGGLQLRIDKNSRDGAGQEQFFYGSVTVGERGQVVIPAKARRDYNIENGDQLLIMGHPSKHGLMMLKVEAIREFLTVMTESLKEFDSGHAMALSASPEGEE